MKIASTDLRYLDNVARKIDGKRRSYGTLKKCEFHFHTPASHDYSLIPGKLYTELSTIDIIDYALEINYISEEAADVLKENLSFYESEEYFKDLKKEGKPFISFKEYLSFMLIAHKLYESGVEVAIITDHNTVGGFRKLRCSLEQYFREKGKSRGKNYVHLFLGVEISCSEQNHLIGIFEDNKYELVQRFLDEIIINEKEGTYLTSQVLIEEINRIDGLAYLAHLNTSNFLGSGVYNKTLFSSGLMNVIGLTNLESEQKVRDRISSFNKDIARKLGIIYESDAHCISKLGTQNAWVKFSKVNFASLKKAFRNHSINIYKNRPNKSEVFIKGMCVRPGDKGFLKDTQDKQGDLVVDFSRDLNCIIGGRGTGKSTILKIIQVALTNEIDRLQNLEFLAEHEKVFILFCCESDQYILEFIPQTKNLSDEYFIDDVFIDGSYTQVSENKILLSSHWNNLYKHEDGAYKKCTNEVKSNILSKVYSRTYNINNIINKINNDQVDNFIKDVILQGLEGDQFSYYIRRLQSVPKRSFNKFIRENINKMEDAVSERKNEIGELISDFNRKYDKQIEIVYSPKLEHNEYYLRELLDYVSGDDSVINTLLTWNDIARYIKLFESRFGISRFLKLLFNKKYTTINGLLKIEDMIINQPTSYKDVHKGLKVIDKNNYKDVYEQMYNVLTSKREIIEKTLINWFEIIDEFTIKFNINSKELNQTVGADMKYITNMSLGQKVVSILSFVFKYGYHVNDSTPLIIDQPEDNLDNQYIYKNLVESLKEIKNARQVIVVTHNSTIVTNADTEQVIVMESDNSNGWIETKGYPSDPIVAKSIINCLEGGIESFSHKVDTYSLFVKQLKIK
ncbi:Spaf_1101 family AAA-like ATPase [Geomicrobium sediminis]|uniref:ATP-dependent endonuclease of OLD family n=1 Tax=Geomicrobium sediminis TaxID=1347788 RepID=A0ABS2PHV8_9BACL|nr:AAA family ATPase [Geomicrobium sediminis]MBM7634408.1 putative ATP-dependent endonuclease of OLD family [Geomicrobium sediminis]